MIIPRPHAALVAPATWPPSMTLPRPPAALLAPAWLPNLFKARAAKVLGAHLMLRRAKAAVRFGEACVRVVIAVNSRW